jgi:hypothetical protein
MSSRGGKAWRELDVIHYRKSQPPPASLHQEKQKASGKYNLQDVVVQLQADFHNKCYLCEEPKPSKIEVDHLQPNNNGTDRNAMFDWNNLFYSCGHCNGTKNGTWPILDCTDSGAFVLSKMSYRHFLDPHMRIRVVVDARASDPATTNAAALLNKIYGGRTPTRTLESANILDKMLENCKAFFRDVERLATESDPVRQASLRRRISRGLAPEVGFTAIRAWQVIDAGFALQFLPELQRLGYN